MIAIGAYRPPLDYGASNASCTHHCARIPPRCPPSRRSCRRDRRCRRQPAHRRFRRRRGRHQLLVGRRLVRPGTSEPQGLGSVGTPFTNSLKADLPNRTVSVYAVNYAANSNQSSAGPGSTDLVNRVTSVAASCPSTVFVLGGYSQGATVVDNTIGLRTSSSSNGSVLPSALSSRVAALVVFGNLIGIQHQTIETASAVYGPKAKSFCNTADPVCGNGNNFSAHLRYARNGSTTTGAQFAATKVNGG